MANYFVEGKISVEINIDIEADSLEEAEKKAMQRFIEDPHALLIDGIIVDDGSDLMAGQYEGEEYND